MTKSKNLVFFGTEDFSLSALKALVDSGYSVLAVVTKPDTKRGRGKTLTAPAVKSYALEHGIEVIQDSSMVTVYEKLASYPTKVAVLSAFGRIIPENLLNHYPLGILNVHPSLLPRHRGASPIEQTILSGDRVAGVSIMKLVNEMDAGPVFAQQKIELDGTENAIDLYDRLASVGADLLLGAIPRVLSGDLTPSSQDESQVTFAPMIKKEDALISWNMNASEIDRKVRAYIRWPGVKAKFGNIDAKILRAAVHSDQLPQGEMRSMDDGILVGCADSTLLVTELQPAGKRPMTANEFLAGNKV